MNDASKKSLIKDGQQGCEVYRTYGGDPTGEHAVQCNTTPELECSECGKVCGFCAVTCVLNHHELSPLLTLPEKLAKKYAERYITGSVRVGLEENIADAIRETINDCANEIEAQGDQEAAQKIRRLAGEDKVHVLQVGAA